MIRESYVDNGIILMQSEIPDWVPWGELGGCSLAIA
jgi:hypothetical protein